MSDRNEVYDWNDEIENDGEYVLLPEGDYDFVVKSFERGRFEGSDRLPACNRAELTLTILANGEEVDVSYNLLLCKKMEWKLSEFFIGIGQKKKGERISMNWNAAVGTRGRCQIGHRASIRSPTKKYNDIKKIYPKEGKGFTAGKF